MLIALAFVCLCFGDQCKCEVEPQAMALVQKHGLECRFIECQSSLTPAGPGPLGLPMFNSISTCHMRCPK